MNYSTHLAADFSEGKRKTYERIVGKNFEDLKKTLGACTFWSLNFSWALKQTCQILRGSFHLHVEFLGRFGWLYIIQLSMIQSSIYSTVSLWPNWSYSSNSKNILLRTFVCWFITFRKNPKCIEESIPDSETSDILLIKRCLQKLTSTACPPSWLPNWTPSAASCRWPSLWSRRGVC